MLGRLSCYLFGIDLSNLEIGHNFETQNRLTPSLNFMHFIYICIESTSFNS